MTRDTSKQIVAGVIARHEKLSENDHKGPFSEDLYENYDLLKDEIFEMVRELFDPAEERKDVSYKALRRELADCGNFIDAMIVICDKEIENGNE